MASLYRRVFQTQFIQQHYVAHMGERCFHYLPEDVVLYSFLTLESDVYLSLTPMNLGVCCGIKAAGNNLASGSFRQP